MSDVAPIKAKYSNGIVEPLEKVEFSDGEELVIMLREEYEELLEDLDDIAVIAQRKDEPTIPMKEVISRLQADDLL
ncbi:MAG: antitoxin family protein [Nitrospirae bacterium]|nr:antitoxin family protein [Nitrospirota bacterium]